MGFDRIVQTWIQKINIVYTSEQDWMSFDRIGEAWTGLDVSGQ